MFFFKRCIKKLLKDILIERRDQVLLFFINVNNFINDGDSVIKKN